MSSTVFTLLDLCCCEGASADGYARAGFRIVGVDIEPQPNYPYEFWQMNGLSLDYEKLAQFDVIHASPPCQKYSRASVLSRKNGKEYPDLYQPFKRMLEASGKPYVIENVVGSPIRGGIGLCGTMFGIGVFRHRLFESNIPLYHPDTPCTCSKKRIDDDTYFTVAGDLTNKTNGLKAMGINRKNDQARDESSHPAMFHGIHRIAAIQLSAIP